MRKLFFTALALTAAVSVLTSCGDQAGSSTDIPAESVQETAAEPVPALIDFTKGYVSINDPTDTFDTSEYPKNYYPQARSIVGRINCCFDVPVGFRRVYTDKDSYMVQYADESGQNIVTAESWNGYTYDEVYAELKHSLSGSYSEYNMMTKDEDTVGKYGYSAHTIYLRNEGEPRRDIIIYVIDKPVEDDEYARDSDGALIYETDPETGERVKQVTARYCFTLSIEASEGNIEGMAKIAASFVTTKDNMESEGIYLG